MFCLVHRMMISHAADGDFPPPGLTMRHIGRCERCGRFYEQCLLISSKLRDESRKDVTERARGTATRAISAIEIQSTALHSRLPVGRFAAAAGIGLVVCAAVFLNMRADKAARESVSVTETDNGASAGLIAVLGKPEEALSGELKQIRNEAESAVRFLFACVNVDIEHTSTAEN